MGQRHLSSVYKNLATEVKGKYAALREVRYEEDKQDDQRFTLINRKAAKEVASLTFRSLPGCCGVALIHSLKGNPNEVLDFICSVVNVARKSKYGQLIFTLRSNSTILETFLAENVEMTDNGGAVCEFLNGKTGNKVTTVVINLKQEAPKPKDTDGE